MPVERKKSAAKSKSPQPPVKKEEASNEIYEKLLQFLRSSMWVMPVMAFIEQNSLSKLSLKPEMQSGGGRPPPL